MSRDRTMIELSTDFSAMLQVPSAQDLHIESNINMTIYENIIHIRARSEVSYEDAIAKIRAFAVNLQKALDDS